jgi:hypothetical protein
MEHFEGHGDHLCALGFKDAMEVMKDTPKRIHNGIPAKEYMYDLPNNKGKLVPILYPNGNPVQICYMLLATDQSNTVESFFPVLEGIKNRGVVTNKFCWTNDIEGEIEIDLGDKGMMDYTFFAPFFRNNFDTIVPGTEVDVYLAGIAYFVEKAPMEYKIDRGGVYEQALKSFLEDNPQKTITDFPFVTIHMDDAVMLFPTNIYSEYEYRGKILDLEYVDFCGKKIAKTKVCIQKDDDCQYKTFINLYIAKNCVRDVELAVGTDIVGKVWMTGYVGTSDLA